LKSTDLYDEFVLGQESQISPQYVVKLSRKNFDQVKNFWERREVFGSKDVEYDSNFGEGPSSKK